MRIRIANLVLLVLALILGMVTLSAQATFITTATYSYSEAPGGESVTFDTYDFAPGVVAMNIDGLGNVTGAFQSYVTSHQLGVSLIPSTVNTNYELTVYGTFTGVSSVIGPAVNFTLTGGTYTIYLDDLVNHSFVGSGSGFTDGTAILMGNITGGIGSYIASPVNAGFSLVFSAFPTPSSVLSPFPPAGESIFGLSAGSLPTGASGVGPISSPTVLLGADGNLRFVPEPTSVWLLCPFLASLVWWQHRRKWVYGASPVGKSG